MKWLGDRGLVLPPWGASVLSLGPTPCVRTGAGQGANADLVVQKGHALGVVGPRGPGPVLQALSVGISYKEASPQEAGHSCPETPASSPVPQVKAQSSQPPSSGEHSTCLKVHVDVTCVQTAHETTHGG